MRGTRVIGIAGGSGSGKTTIVQKISQIVSDFTFLPEDNYYKPADQIPKRSLDVSRSSRESRISNANISDFNFDHPNAFDVDLLARHLARLKDRKAVEMPQYDFVHHARRDETVHLTPKKLIIFEGILIFADQRIRDLIDLKIYVDTPDDIRFIRRLKRDIDERGRTVDSVITQYLDVVRPGHFEFIEPTKLYADLIVPEGGMNESAIEVLATFIQTIVG